MSFEALPPARCNTIWEPTAHLRLRIFDFPRSQTGIESGACIPLFQGTCLARSSCSSPMPDATNDPVVVGEVGTENSLFLKLLIKQLVLQVTWRRGCHRDAHCTVNTG